MGSQPTNRDENPGGARSIRCKWRNTVEVEGTLEQLSPLLCLIRSVHLNN
jgi:hypothetical protein